MEREKKERETAEKKEMGQQLLAALHGDSTPVPKPSAPERNEEDDYDPHDDGFCHAHTTWTQREIHFLLERRGLIPPTQQQYERARMDIMKAVVDRTIMLFTAWKGAHHIKEEIDPRMLRAPLLQASEEERTIGAEQ